MKYKILCTITLYIMQNNLSYKNIRNIIIRNKIIQPLYIELNENINNKFCSLEHIYPKSYLDDKHHNDMHNLFKTLNIINSRRSNYKYCDIDELNKKNKNWIKLNENNYYNTKESLFIPNKNCHGIISRTIMYMTHKYNYDPYKIISKKNLINWCLNNPPDYKEQYHNYLVYKYQKTNNIFITNYNNSNYNYYINNLF